MALVSNQCNDDLPLATDHWPLATDTPCPSQPIARISNLTNGTNWMGTPSPSASRSSPPMS